MAVTVSHDQMVQTEISMTPMNSFRPSLIFSPRVRRQTSCTPNQGDANLLYQCSCSILAKAKKSPVTW